MPKARLCFIWLCYRWPTETKGQAQPCHFYFDLLTDGKAEADGGSMGGTGGECQEHITWICGSAPKQSLTPKLGFFT